MHDLTVRVWWAASACKVGGPVLVK